MNNKIDRTKIFNDDYRFNVINDLIKSNEFYTNKFGMSKKVNQNGENMLANMAYIELENLREKYGEDNFNKRLSFNPYLLIKQAVSKATKRQKVQETQMVDAVDSETFKKIKVLGENVQEYKTKAYIDGQEFYNNLIKSNGLSKEFMKLAKVGFYGKMVKDDNGKIHKDTISIRYENFVQGAKHITYKDKKGNEYTIIVHKYISKYNNVWIFEYGSGKGGIEMSEDFDELLNKIKSDGYEIVSVE